MSVAINLPGYIDALTLLGDESRLRLCALLRERELCVTDLVRVTGIAQSRVSTHLGRLREAGFVRDRRKGAQSFYALAADALPAAVRALPRRGGGVRAIRRSRATSSACASSRPSGAAALPESFADELERDYSPGRTWQSLARRASRRCCGSATCSTSARATARRPAALAPYCRSLTCIDTNARMIEAASERLAQHAARRAPQVADVARAAVRATRRSTPCSCSTR